MGNCFSNSRPEDDLRSHNGIGPVKEQQKKNHKNPFKQNQKSKQVNQSPIGKSDYLEQFNQGKFTFEPNGKQPIHQVVGNDISDNGVSFGGANRLQENHLSFNQVDGLSKFQKSFYNQGRDSTIKEQPSEEELQ
ncbi:UNKNOWN [Stylonychia lemnae]|uniref:Uncharacterized protein n=1 Tax=Stylonychia lemnae TaxID=5949 RepID=A0A077ZQU8_STYLE|nr:UNKNOWN [Stylonychia lemnae]|eukprot:CDW72277.1 UNKNOWN [Stylonychia lemnae]